MVPSKGTHQIAAIQHNARASRACVLQRSLEVTAERPTGHLEQQEVFSLPVSCFRNVLLIVQINLMSSKRIGNRASIT